MFDRSGGTVLDGIKGRLNCTLFIVLIFISLAQNVHGKGETVTVAYTEWFPYTFQDNGKPSGFEIDIFRAVVQRMGVHARFAQYPWKRCLYSIERGDVDAVISMLKTPEREVYTYYPDEHISFSKTVLFTTRDRRIKFEGSYESLKGYTVGIIMGFSYGEKFDSASFLNKDESKDVGILISKLLKGRVDLAAENKFVVGAYAKKMAVAERIRFFEPPIHSQKLYVGFSKKKNLQGLSDRFSKALREFKKTDAFRAILRKYGIHPSEMAEGN